MPVCRSRATGMKDGDFGKPMIAIVNCFTQFVPGHVHLKDLGQMVPREVDAAGGVAKEFNTIAFDDGIAMGHDRMSRRVPCLSKVAPVKQDVHMEDVHCAGGMMAILGQRDVAGLLNRDGAALQHWDTSRTNQESVRHFFRAAPGNVRTAVAFSQNKRDVDLDLDREHGVIRSVKHAFSKDGGLAVRSGNIAPDGCIVKTAGVDESILVFSGPARVFESQNASVEAILSNEIKPGGVVVIRYEGPKGGPGMQEMLYPTSYLKSKGLGKACALLTDGRFSAGTSGPVDWPCQSRGGLGRADRIGAGRRYDRHRHSGTHDFLAGQRSGSGYAPRRAGCGWLGSGEKAAAQG